MSFLEDKERSLVPAFIVGTTIMQLILFLVVTMTFGKVDEVVKSRIPSLVELNDGTTIRVAPGKERSAQTISVFTGKVMYRLMSWNSILPSSSSSNPATPRQDEGVEVGGRVTTSTWEASFALSQDFRQQFLEELAQSTPPEVFSGNTQTILDIRHLSQPQEITSGKWRQNMVANLVVFRGQKQDGKAIPFNKTIFIRTVETALLPKNSSRLQKTVYKARKDGLEIYKIQELVQ